MIYVRALKEAHRILKFNYISINCMIPLKIDIHIIIVNIFKIDPAVCLNKTCTNCYIQNTFATISYTQLKEDKKDKLDNKINQSDILSN